MKNKTLVFIPTYNEKNVENILTQIMVLNIPLDILFLDDNSPDGTGEILDNLAKKYDEVYVIHREGKMGIGSAHLEGIKWAYDNGYTKLITMDCVLHTHRNISGIL
ncbi:MAG: glycosyltransferase [Candidatus Hydrogenedentota bacterium]